VRQSLFDILAPRVPGCRFLDAFAGNGGVGLEALSRGAARVVLVDQSRAAIEVIRENARAWPPRAGTCRSTTRTPASRWPPSPIPASASTSSTSIRLMRAPSTSRCSRRRRGCSETAGVVVAEHFHKRALPETIGGLVSTRSVRIGDHRLTFYEARHD
jgi:16S rRNA G966 N2-methylase RsmD